MKKAAVIIGGLALAGCGSVPIAITSIIDLVNGYTVSHCGYTFTEATINAVIKALTGQPVADIIGGFLCNKAQALAAQQAPRAAGAVGGQGVVQLGVVDIGGKLVPIQVYRQ